MDQVNSEAESDMNEPGPRWKSFRGLIFAIALLAVAGAVAVYFLPVNKDTLIRVLGPGGKYGFINARGQIAIKPEWNFARAFDSEGMAAVERNGKWGWIDRSGELAVALNWDQCGDFDSEGMARVSIVDKGGWIDRQGNVVIPVEWKYASDFDKFGTARVNRTDSYGWIDRNGQIVVPPKWSFARDFEENGLAAVEVGDKWGWINREQEIVIEPEWDEVFDFGVEDTAVVVRQRRMGLVDQEGNVVVSPEWEWVRGGYDEEGAFRCWDSEGWMLAQKDAQWGWIRRDGGVAIPMEWDLASRFTREGVAPVARGKKASLIDRKGNVLATIDGGIAPFDTNGRALVAYADNITLTSGSYFSRPPRWECEAININGWIDTAGEMVIRLPGEGWETMDERRPVSLDTYVEFTNSKLGYYTAAKMVRPSGFRKTWLKFLSMWDEEAEEALYEETLCHCYNTDGKLIWSSAWMIKEKKCILVGWVAAMVALFVRPRRAR